MNTLTLLYIKISVIAKLMGVKFHVMLSLRLCNHLEIENQLVLCVACKWLGFSIALAMALEIVT
jgi:hypothetical protein